MTTSPHANKILFVTPPYHYGLVDVLGRWIPLNLVYLAAAARQAGVEAEIYDAQNLGHGYREIEERLARSGAAYVACSAVTATINEVLRTLEFAKSVLPGVVTILGGVHASFMYREILEESPAVDYVVVGEGEHTLRELLAVLQEGGDPRAVPGLACRGAAGIVRSAERLLEANLDRLPAAWDLIAWENYGYQAIAESRLGSVSTSRGCDHDCSFCSQRELWCGSWRARTPERVVDELELLHRRHGVNVFQVTDEYPTRDRGRWEAILDLLIGRKLPIHLIIETRAPDLVRDCDIMAKYRAAGVIHVSIGVEGKEQQTLDSLRKGMQLEHTVEAVELLRAYGIISEVSFVLGFPEETFRNVAETLKFAQGLNPDSANFLPLTPWPWTDLYREHREAIREDDYSKYNLIDPVLEPRQMTLQQLDLALTDCFRKFYMGKMFEVMTMKDEFRRGYMVRATKVIMSSPFVFKKFGQLVRGIVPAKIDEMKQKLKQDT